MSTDDDLATAIDRSHGAVDSFAQGDPEPLKALYSHRDDVSLANPFGPAVRGWREVADTMERAAAHYRDGRATGFDRIAEYRTSELAYVVEVEHLEARIGGSPDRSPVALRVTTVLRPENDGWRIIHRHADPITAPRPAASVVQG